MPNPIEQTQQPVKSEKVNTGQDTGSWLIGGIVSCAFAISVSASALLTLLSSPADALILGIIAVTFWALGMYCVHRDNCKSTEAINTRNTLWSMFGSASMLNGVIVGPSVGLAAGPLAGLAFGIIWVVVGLPVWLTHRNPVVEERKASATASTLAPNSSLTEQSHQQLTKAPVPTAQITEPPTPKDANNEMRPMARRP